MKKLSETQINALRLAAEVPSCLSSDFNKPTTRALERMGLIEGYGTFTVADGIMSTKFGITEKGRKHLTCRQCP